LAGQHAEPAAVAADVGRVGAALGAPAGRRMVVPGPARRDVDLQPHRVTDAAAGRLDGGGLAGLWARGSSHLEPRPRCRAFRRGRDRAAPANHRPTPGFPLGRDPGDASATIGLCQESYISNIVVIVTILSISYAPIG